MKRIGILFLAVLLVLPMMSCAQKNTPESSGGGSLVETRIDLDNKSPLILDIFRSVKGYEVVSTDGVGKVLHRSTLHLTADGSGEQTSLITVATVAEDQNIYAATISPQTIIVFCCITKNGDTKNYIVDPNGKTIEIEIAPTAVSFVKFLDSTSLLVEDQTRSLMRFDIGSMQIEAKYHLNKEQMFVSHVVVDRSLIVLIVEVVDGVAVYSVKEFDLESGKEINDAAGLTRAISSVLPEEKMSELTIVPTLSEGAKTGEVFVLSKGSVYVAYSDGTASVWADGESTNLTNTFMHPIMLLPSDSGLVILFQDLTNYDFRLYSYRFGKMVAEEKLIIYMLYDNPEIRQTAALYQEQYGNTEMVIQVGIPRGATLSAEDAIRQLNLDIFAGNGPDIIVLDGLSIDHLQKEKLLLDIGDVLSRVESANDEYFKSVLTSFSNAQNGCYAIPTRFTIPSIFANTELLGRIDSMEALTEIVESYRGEEQTFLGLSCDLATFFTADYGNIIQGDYVSKEELSRFFEFSKRMVSIAEETFELNKDLYSQNNLDIIAFAIGGFTSKQYSQMVVSALLIPQPAQAQIGIVTRASEFPNINLTIDNSDNDFAFGLLCFTDKQVFSPAAILGVSSACQSIDLAKQFIEFALSKEQQTSDQGVGLPVNLTAFREVLERASAGGVEVSFGGKNVFTREPLTEDEVERYLDLADSAESAFLADETITDIVKTELESYLRGNKPLDDAVETAYQKIKLYLIE